jgi:uncharacterized protein with NAD-binding domain and iron-sulfur cluster
VLTFSLSLFRAFFEGSAEMNLFPVRQCRAGPKVDLAGDYTQQKYLATMEGGVVSGRRAACVVEAAAARRASRSVPPPLFAKIALPERADYVPGKS